MFKQSKTKVNKGLHHLWRRRTNTKSHPDKIRNLGIHIHLIVIVFNVLNLDICLGIINIMTYTIIKGIIKTLEENFQFHKTGGSQTEDRKRTF